MTKHYDVTALGEVLIDFTENGSSAQGNPMYEANPGGAPCNVRFWARSERISSGGGLKSC